MHSAAWLRYFTANRHNFIEPDWQAPIPLTTELRSLLARSLSHFQLGESGGGQHLFGKAGEQEEAYRAALKLFVAEEAEHARLLQGLVIRFGGRLIKRHWTHLLFRAARRALGLNFEIQVLLIAELVGTAYYRMLHRRARDPILDQVCDASWQMKRSTWLFISTGCATSTRRFCRRNGRSGRCNFNFSSAPLCWWRGSIIAPRCARSGRTEANLVPRRGANASGFSTSWRPGPAESRGAASRFPALRFMIVSSRWQMIAGAAARSGRGKSEHHTAACRAKCAGAVRESGRRRKVSQKIYGLTSAQAFVAKVKRRGKSSPLTPQGARQEKPHAVQDKTEEGQPVR